MRLLFTLSVLVSIVSCAAAADLAWPDGTVWHDVRFVSWDQQNVTLAHDGTTTVTLIRSLPGDARMAVYNAMAAAIRSAPEDQLALNDLKPQGIHFFGTLSQLTSKTTAFAHGVAQWRDEEPLDIAIVGTLPADAVDGTRWVGWLWPAGRSQHTDLEGILQTRRRYATSPELALALKRSE